MQNEMIAAKLRELRGEKSREEVANAVGTSVSAIQMYENGARIPRDEIKIKLAQFYGTTVAHIFFSCEPHDKCGIDANNQAEKE